MLSLQRLTDWCHNSINGRYYFGERLPARSMCRWWSLNSRLFIADILVNGTGAMMVLLFLFVVRLNPQTDSSPPTSLNRPMMLIDISSADSIGDQVVPFSVRLSTPSVGDFIAVPNAGVGVFEVQSPTMPDTTIGAWGVAAIPDGMRIIVPCPETGDWTLVLTYPGPSTSLRHTEHAVDVRVQLLADEQSSLSDVGAAPTGETEKIYKNFFLGFENPRKRHWHAQVEETCHAN